MKLRTGIWIGVGLVAVALVSVPFLLPLDTYRGSIESAAASAIGREVHIKGPMHLTVYPQLGLSLSDVTIGNAPGSKDPEMVSVGSVVVGAELMPLLSKQLKVTEVVLQKPVIHLEVAKDGTPNWRFGPALTPAQAAAAQRRPAGAPAAPGSDAQGFQFRTVSIDDGELTYSDAQSGASEALHKISIHMTLQPGSNPQVPLQAPLNVAGELTYNGEALKIDGKVERFSAMLNGQPTVLHLGITSNIINADFSGSLNEDRISGALKMGAHSVRSFAAWAGHPMPAGNGFGLMAMEGQFSVRDGVYTLQGTHLAFDSMSMNADLTIDTNPSVPALKGQVTIDKLDVNPYLAPGKETDTVKAAKAKTPADKTAPLEFGWLKAANADLKLVLGGLIVPDLKLEHAIVTLALHDGALKADLSNVAAYGGTGKGTFTLDAANATPALHETLDISGLKAQPFLDDVLGVNRISGTAALKVDLTARGTSKDALLKGMNGKGSIKFSDGTITGVDLAAVARVLQSVLTTDVLNGAVGDNAKTAFGSLGGTFTVQNGVLNTNDLTLESDVVQMTAKGNVDIPAHAIDFHFEPKAKKGIPGLKLVDIGVPFNVKGPWDHPSYAPDAGGIVKSVVNRLGDDASIPVDLLKNPGGTLKSLFGGGGKSK